MVTKEEYLQFLELKEKVESYCYKKALAEHGTGGAHRGRVYRDDLHYEKDKVSYYITCCGSTSWGGDLSVEELFNESV